MNGKSTSREAVAIVTRRQETSDPDLLAEDVDWNVLHSWPAGGRYRGRLAVRDEFFTKLLSMFAEYGVEVDVVTALDESRVVSFGRYVGKVTAQSVSFSSKFAHVWTLEAGRISAFEQIADTAAVRDALLASGKTQFAECA